MAGENRFGQHQAGVGNRLFSGNDKRLETLIRGFLPEVANSLDIGGGIALRVGRENPCGERMCRVKSAEKSVGLLDQARQLPGASMSMRA